MNARNQDPDVHGAEDATAQQDVNSTEAKHARMSDDSRLPLRWAPAQLAASAMGALFLLVGALGFIPGITTHYDRLALAGHHSGALLLGAFNISVLHNIVHLGFGVAGVALAPRFRGARNYLIVGGFTYLVLSLYGSLVDRSSAANFVPINNADNWLHLGLGVSMIGLGLALFGRRSDTAAVGQISPITVTR